MRLPTLLRRNLRFHWRTNLAVTLGVVAATATLSGALLVGDSMRGSLRAAALGRLGRVTHALVSRRYLREALTAELAGGGQRVCPAILLRGGVTHAETRARAGRVSVLGVDERFWMLDDRDRFRDLPALTGRSVVLNEPLARELGAQPGDDVLLRIGKPATISTETLLGRRARTALTLRLTVRGVVPAEGLGAFVLRPRQTLPKNAYVPLPVLQRALGQRGRVNALLVAGQAGPRSAATSDGSRLQRALRRRVKLDDLGLRLRVDTMHGYLALESDRLLLEAPVEDAARATAERLGAASAGVLTYLANEIARPAGGQAIPYSTVAALGPRFHELAPLPLVDGTRAAPLRPGEILLNEWAARDLAAAVGERIALRYYVVDAFGRLETRRAAFTLRGIVRLAGTAADPGFAPQYPGLTDAARITDWDPPFPIDLRRIRDKDEAYWARYRATPKAFISLADGRRLWAEQAERFGRLTSLRLAPAGGGDAAGLAAAFERGLLQRLDPARLGLRFQPVRAQAIAAGTGATDFGGLFVGFSFFLVVSAAMLVALLFRLGVERRSRELGTLLATGFTRRTVAGLLLAEGAAVVGIGGAVGLAAALGYAWLMLAGLRSWWAAAVHAPFLRLEVTGTSLAIGYGASFVIGLLAILWSIRGLTRLSPRTLLAGRAQADEGLSGRGAGRVSAALAVGAGLVAAALLAAPALSDALSQTLAFFAGGTALLVACLALFAHRLKSPARRVIHRAGRLAWARLGVRNAPRNRGRSILTAALVACATFVIVALQGFRLEAGAASRQKDAGTGGFALLAEAAVPLVADLNTPAGRAALHMTPAAERALADVTAVPFRLRSGDEVSCLNLYRPRDPRILGATEAMIRRGGFRFGATLAASEQERGNPWVLLHRTFPDGAVPAIGDEGSVLWQLHLGLGRDLIITDERGRDVRLRLVALLKGSVLQSELVIAEARFVRLFPSISGYGFFLIEAPPARTSAVEQTLERELTDFGFDATATSDRLNELYAVQNTYLSTFQTLGGLGLILGTLGLAAVLLRNVWERRSELALLQAVGFSRGAIGWMVLAENAYLVVVGLLAGLLPAIVATAPHVASRPEALPWQSVGLMLGGVFAVGLIAGSAALLVSLRAPLLPALRAE